MNEPDVAFGLVTMASAIVTVGGPLLVVAWVKDRNAARLRDRKLDRVIAVHEGIPADSITGQPARPGLIERMDTQDVRLDDLARKTAVTYEQVATTNGGSTLLDKVNRTVAQGEAAAKQAAVAAEQVTNLAARYDADRATDQDGWREIAGTVERNRQRLIRGGHDDLEALPVAEPQNLPTTREHRGAD